MLTKTSEIGIKALIYLGLHNHDQPISPRQIAAKLGVSPTYLSKTCSLLVKANILRAHKGALGGVTLSHPPEQISLLSIVEACQGQVVGDFCRETDQLHVICSFHTAMLELHQSMISVLNRWSLADLLKKPIPEYSHHAGTDCRMLALESAVREVD